MPRRFGKPAVAASRSDNPMGQTRIIHALFWAWFLEIPPVLYPRGEERDWNVL